MCAQTWLLRYLNSNDSRSPNITNTQKWLTMTRPAVSHQGSGSRRRVCKLAPRVRANRWAALPTWGRVHQSSRSISPHLCHRLPCNGENNARRLFSNISSFSCTLSCIWNHILHDISEVRKNSERLLTVQTQLVVLVFVFYWVLPWPSYLM